MVRKKTNIPTKNEPNICVNMEPLPGSIYACEEFENNINKKTKNKYCK